MARKRINLELKEGIEETISAIDALTDSEFPASIAALMFKVKEEFIKAGFSHDEALQLIIAHGVQPPH